MAIPTTILAGLVMLAVLVAVHEFGHFLAAKIFNVGVPIFSIGMGPRVAGFVWRGTDYRLSLFPVGGYVRMSGADPFGEEDPDAWVDPSEDFMKKPVWQRLIIMFAGPGMNLVLPLVLVFGILVIGEEVPDSTIGQVIPDSVAEKHGIQPLDRVVMVEGHPSTNINDLYEAFISPPPDGSIDLVVDRRGEQLPISIAWLDVPRTERGDVDFERLGMLSTRLSAKVGVSDTTSPAWRAGLRTGDGIDKVDGVVVRDWYALRAAIDSGDVHTLSVLRAAPTEADPLHVSNFHVTLSRDPAWSAPADEGLPDAYGIVPVSVFVGGVAEASPAAVGGVLPNDRMYSIDGHPIRGWSDLTARVLDTADVDALNGPTHAWGCASWGEANPVARAMDFVVIRDGKTIHLNFAPEIVQDDARGARTWRPRAGISTYAEAYVPSDRVVRSFPPLQAAARAGSQTFEVAKQTAGMLVKLAIGEASPQNTLGGPVEIFRRAGQSAQLGPTYFLRLMATISISLGIVNLLPVPVLDGGQILFYSIEGIRGRPLPLALRERLQMVGVLALVALVLMVFVWDMSAAFR